MALQLYSNLSFTYPLPKSSNSLLESVSLIFNPEHTLSGNLLQSISPRNGNGSNPEVLRLSNGSVIFDYGSGFISAGGGTLQTNQWYEVYATRYVAVCSC